MLPLGRRKDIGRRCEAWKHEMMVRVEELVFILGQMRRHSQRWDHDASSPPSTVTSRTDDFSLQQQKNLLLTHITRKAHSL